MKNIVFILLAGILALGVFPVQANGLGDDPTPYRIRMDCRSLTIGLPNVSEDLENVRVWLYVAKPGGKYFLKWFVWDGYRNGIGSVTAPADSDFLYGDGVLLLTVDGTIKGDRFTQVSQITTDNIILASCLPKSLDISRMR